MGPMSFSELAQAPLVAGRTKKNPFLIASLCLAGPVRVRQKWATQPDQVSSARPPGLPWQPSETGYGRRR